MIKGRRHLQKFEKIVLLMILGSMISMLFYNFLSNRPGGADSGEASSFLVIEAFNKDGQLFTVPYIYASDIEGEPFPYSFEKEGLKHVCLLLDSPLLINVLWEVQGFGKLILTADNEGEGYKKNATQKQLYVNLNYELAKSHFKKVYKEYEKHLLRGYVFSSELEKLVEGSRVFLEKARNAPDNVTRASLSDKSLNSSLWAGEKLALEIAKQNIERFRMANVTLKIVDENGNPVGNITVIAEQLDLNVMFACNTRGFEMRDLLTDFELYKERFKELFNTGMVHFFWPMFEPEEGKYEWESRDAAVNWLRSNGLRVWGHLLIWLHEWSVPDWAKKKSYDDLKTVLRNLCYEPVHRYRDTIDLWNVFNEPEWGNVLQLSVDQQIELLRIGLDAVREANPNAIRMINPTIVWGEYAAWGLTAEGPAKRKLLTPFQFIKEVENRGIRYEAIGLQLYMGSGGMGSGFSIRDMFTIAALLDKYAQFGKSIHITELGVPSRFEDIGDKIVTEAGYWHRPWDEEIQADWVEQFYTIAFGNPSVESISWFDLADYTRVFIPWGGLLNEDMMPKQSYYRLKNLLKSWTTHTEGITNSQGEYFFRGFKGSYKITIEKDGKIVTILNLNVEADVSKIIAIRR